MKRRTSAEPPRRSPIWGLVAALSPFYRLLEGKELTTSERKSCATRLYPNGANFVTTVARVLRDSRRLFRDIRQDPADLDDWQDTANALKALSDHLGKLKRYCDDLFLKVQSEALKQSLAVVELVRLERQLHPPNDPLTEQRSLAMSKAEALLPKRRTYRSASWRLKHGFAEKKSAGPLQAPK
jgi:hypothetical protein